MSVLSRSFVAGLKPPLWDVPILFVMVVIAFVVAFAVFIVLGVVQSVRRIGQ